MHKANCRALKGRQRTRFNGTRHRELSAAEKKAQTDVDSTTAERHVAARNGKNRETAFMP